MTKQYKFKITMNFQGEQKEFLFATRKEVAEFLEIKPSTLYTIQNGTSKMKKKDMKKLEGIKVERLEVFYNAKPNPEDVDRKILEYQERLVNRMNNIPSGREFRSPMACNF